MCTQNGLLKRKHGYYFQARVPEDCREEFGKVIYRKKLTATTQKAAIAEVRQEWVAFNQRIERYRAGFTRPTDADIQRWADAFLAYHLEEDEEERTKGLDDTGYRKAQEMLDIVYAGGREELARGDTRNTEFEMVDFLDSRFGVKLEPDTDCYRKTAYAFLKASVKATELLLARQWGEIVDTPRPPTGPQRGAPIGTTAGIRQNCRAVGC